MFTWGSKYLFGISGFAFLGAILYGLISGGGPIGVISAGYKGGVGDHVGYTVLVAIGIATLFLGIVNVIIRDGDAAVASETVGADGALFTSTPRPSFWAPMAAFGVACLAVGIAVSLAFTILGIVILAVVLLEWTVLAWADRATGDETVNETIRSRVIGPMELPIMAMVGIGVVVIGISRILLTVDSKAASTTVASVVAALVFASAVAMSRVKVSRSVMTGVVAVGALVVLGGGIVGAVRGPREIVHHGEHSEHGEHGGDHGDEGGHGEGGEGEGE